MQGSAYGDAIWTFSLKGQLGPLWGAAPAADSLLAQPDRFAAGGRCDQDRCQQHRVQALLRHVTRIKAGTTVSFTNVGDITA